MEETREIDGKLLVKNIMKRAWIIVACAVLVAVGSFVYTKNFVKPTYKASITMYVNNKSETGTNAVSSSNLAVAMQLAKSYVNIIQSETVLAEVITQAKMTNITAAEVREMMSAECLDDTEMFRVDIISRNPQQAADIANAIGAYAPSVISDVIEGSSAKVVDYAKVPNRQYAPNLLSNVVLGGLAGGVLAVVLIAVFLLTDTRIKCEEDLLAVHNIPVLGMIPDFMEAAKSAEQNGNRKERRRS